MSYALYEGRPTGSLLVNEWLAPEIGDGHPPLNGEDAAPRFPVRSLRSLPGSSGR